MPTIPKSLSGSENLLASRYNSNNNRTSNVSNNNNSNKNRIQSTLIDNTFFELS